MPSWAAIVLTLAMLLVAPARAWEKQSHLYQEVFQPFFTLDEKTGEYRASRPGMDTEPFPAKKGPGTFRVFIVGATTTHAFAGPRDLEHALQIVLPGRKIEMLRCGLSGYDSYRDSIIVKEILDYEPDLIVELSGVNELVSLYYPLPPWIRDVDAYAPGPWRERLDDWLKTTPLVGDDNWVEHRAARLEEFYANLKLDVKRAKARGVPVLLAAPPINYRDSAANLPLPFADAVFTSGWVRYLKGDWRGAVGVWKASRAEPRLRSLIDFYLGRAYEKLGEAGRARESYRAAVEGGEFKFCAPRCLALIKRVADEEKTGFADVDAAFQAADAPRMPGLDMFLDQNQWIRKEDAVVSVALLRGMRAMPELAGLPWDDAALERLARGWIAGSRAQIPDSFLEAMLHYAVWELIWRKKKDDLMWPSVVWFEFGLELKPAWFASTEALYRRVGPTLEQAKVSERDRAALMPQLYWHLGEARLRRGELPRALQELDRALALDPTLYPALLSRGLAQALSGDDAAARESFAQAAAHGLRAEADALSAALGLSAAR